MSRRSRTEKVEWALLSRPVADMLNGWADRRDLLAYLGPDRGGATAFCDMLRGEIEANTDLIYRGYTAQDVLKHGVTNYRRFPVAIGALYHEAMHARHSPRADLSPVLSTVKDGREVDVFFMLEEPRIEYRGISHDPDMRPYLRASGLRVTIEAKKENGTDGTVSPTDLMPLTLGRVIAGSLEASDVAEVRGLYVDTYTEETVAQAEELLRRFIYLPDAEHEEMLNITRQWCTLFPEEPDASDALQELLDALNGAATNAGTGAMGDLDDKARSDKRQARDRERAAKQNRERDARRAGNKKRTPSIVYGGGSYGATGTVPFKERKPTAEERAAAVRLANILAQVEYSDKVRSHVASEVPPGRPRMRTVVNNRGARAAGSTARPQPEWEMLRRTVVESPTLRVGLIVDVSGSMSRAMEPMATTAYVLSTALERIHARTSVNYMGGDAYTARQSKEIVQVWQARAGWENVVDAVALLDSDIDLTLEENGARLAVMVSDGQYRTEQKRAAMDWMRLLKSQGASVLFLGYGEHSHAEGMCREAGVQFVPMTGNETPAEAATIVGNAAVQVLRENKLTG